MKRHYLISFIMAWAISAGAQQIYSLSEPPQEKPIVWGKVQLSGSNPSGGTIRANNLYLEQDGKPYIPIMGEFHYCRYPNGQWEEQLKKMKAGGIQVVCTYVFWNIHEPKEGEYRWTNDLDLRRFIRLCQQLGMQAIVRIGPFAHGEIRNGGLPDWLYTKPVDVRSNDSIYLEYTDRWFSNIAQQLRGLYYKDGGPIIGIQIENEHQHAASTWALSYMGKSEYTSATYDQAFAHLQISPDERQHTMSRLGDEHMATLLALAKRHGMDVPIYTATGWGNAATLGYQGLPVMAAYPYATWTDITKMSSYCLFTDLRHTPDYAPVRFDAQEFPSIYAEMGCGIQMGYDRRPIVYPRGVATMLLRSLGSGSNGFGYYMYHGGSSPKMAGGTDYYAEGNGFLPRISYDFQAPLSESGQERESYRRLRLIHHFIQEFGADIAPMATVLPESYQQLTPDNQDCLRYAARMKDGRGYLFLINYQDHDSTRHSMENICMKLQLKREQLMIPQQGTFNLPKDANIIMPFNFQMGDALLKYATAQPLMVIQNGSHPHYFFFVPDGMKAEYLFDAKTVKGKTLFRQEAGLTSTFTIHTVKGHICQVTTLTEQQALDAAKVDGRLLITSATVLPDKQGGATLLSVGNPQIEYILYPSAHGLKKQSTLLEAVKPSYRVKEWGGQHLMTVHFNDSISHSHVHEYFLNLDYTADVAMAFLGNELVGDDFWHGCTWTLGLQRFKFLLSQEDMTIRLRPIQAGHPCLKSLPANVIPDFSQSSKVCQVKRLEIIPEYKLDIKWEK